MREVIRSLTIEKPPGTLSSRPAPVSWPGIVAGVLPFLVAGAYLILNELPRDWPLFQALAGGRSVAFLAFLFIPAIGFGIGWVREFPRWSYPYVGYTLIISLFMTNVATPSLRLLGHTFQRGELWGWRACIAPLAMALVAGLLTRSLRPVTRLFSNLWDDWSLVTYALFGFMPLLLAIAFDEVDRLYSLIFMIPLTALMIATAIVYLAGTRLWQRALGLAAGIAATITLTAVGATLYWYREGGLSIPVVIAQTVGITAVMAGPALAEWLRRAVQPGLAASP